MKFTKAAALAGFMRLLRNAAGSKSFTGINDSMLVAMTGQSSRYVQLRLRELEALGWIRRTRSAGRREITILDRAERKEGRA